MQLYESYAHANYNITVLNARPAAYLASWVAALQRGWEVRFSDDDALNFTTRAVALAPAQLLVGLANGWAGGFHPKSLLIMPEEVGAAFGALAASGVGAPRGAVYWCVEEEGVVPAAQSEPLFLAAGLNAVLHARPQTKKN